MKYFFTRISFFSFPLILWLMTVIIIDPYNYLNNSIKIIDNETKLSTSYKINFPLFKLLKFKKNPTQGILLGDSRVDILNIEDVENYSNVNFTNLAYGGGSVKEIIDTFWEVIKYADLKEVYIGLNLFSYNSFQKRDRVTEAIPLTENYTSYITSNYSNKATLLILKTKILNLKPEIGIPSSSKDQFWIDQLKYADKIYGLYSYPDHYYDELKKIAVYCHTNNIKLIFFSPPSHKDLQQKIITTNLVSANKKFKTDIKTLGDYYDYDIIGSDLTTNKENFTDPFHITKKTAKKIIKELFSGNSSYGEFHKYKN